MTAKSVLVTGASGYVGKAVAKAFARAGWRTYGLVRCEEEVGDLAKNETQPMVSPSDGAIFEGLGEGPSKWWCPTGRPDRCLEAFGGGSGHAGRAVARTIVAGRRPLVMFLGGRDYGAMTYKHGDPALAPHTEASPLTPAPAFAVLVPRCTFGAQLLDKTATPYDAVVL